MAWSLSFTSSASSILEVKDRQPVREVQNYHKAGASLGRGVEVSEKQGEIRFGSGGEKQKSPTRQERLWADVQIRPDTCNEGVLGKQTLRLLARADWQVWTAAVQALFLQELPALCCNVHS